MVFIRKPLEPGDAGKGILGIHGPWKSKFHHLVYIVRVYLSLSKKGINSFFKIPSGKLT